MKSLALAHSVHLLQSDTMWVRGGAFHTCAVACRYLYLQFQVSETSLLYLAIITRAMTAGGRLYLTCARAGARSANLHLRQLVFNDGDMVDNNFKVALLQLPLAAAWLGVHRGLLSYEGD